MEFVEDGQTAVRGLAAELGIRLLGTGMSYSNRQPRDAAGAVPRAEVPAGVEALRSAGPRGTVAQALPQVDISDRVRRAVAARLRVSFAQDPARLPP